MEKQNNKEHRVLSSTLEKVLNKLDKLDEKLESKFVMRREFKVAIGLLGAFATILGIIGFFVK